MRRKRWSMIWSCFLLFRPQKTIRCGVFERAWLGARGPRENPVRNPIFPRGIEQQENQETNAKKQPIGVELPLDGDAPSRMSDQQEVNKQAGPVADFFLSELIVSEDWYDAKRDRSEHGKGHFGPEDPRQRHKEIQYAVDVSLEHIQFHDLLDLKWSPAQLLGRSRQNPGKHVIERGRKLRNRLAAKGDVVGELGEEGAVAITGEPVFDAVN